MNYEDRFIRVEHINHLNKPSSASLTLNQELVLANLFGKRRLGLPDNSFRFLPIDAMLANVVSVPLNPPKLHGLPLE